MGGDVVNSHRHVTLSPFYVARNAITKAQFRIFLKETGRKGNEDELGPSPSGWKFESMDQWINTPGLYKSCPSEACEVHSQTWLDAVAYAEWLSKRNNRRFRLITEAEWEYIARSGIAMGEQDFWWQATQPSGLSCWVHDSSHQFTAIAHGEVPGTDAMTPWGIYLESYCGYWMRDLMADYPNHDEKDPTGPVFVLDRRRVTRSIMIRDRSSWPESSANAGIFLVADPIPADRHLPPSVAPEMPPKIDPIVPLQGLTLHLSGDVALTLRKIPAAHVTIGRSPDIHPWSDEWPETEVALSDYWLGITDVTEEQFQAVTGINPSLVPGPHKPVHSIIFPEMLAFCDLLTTRERKLGRLGPDEEYRLPTEAEYECAALAGVRTLYSFGDDPALLHWYAWFEAAEGPHDVATKLPNRWGFYDMQGNVLELMCEKKNRYWGKLVTSNWQPLVLGEMEGQFSFYFAARGGAWDMGAIAAQPSVRRAVDIMSRCDHVGFRLARGPVLPPPGPPRAFTTWMFPYEEFRKMDSYKAIMASPSKSFILESKK